MPEGDTIFRAAAVVRSAILGREVVDLWGSARELQRFAGRLHGTTITDVESRGKHHLVVFDDRFVIRTHMGMTGSWRVFEPGDRWTKSRGKARVVIETSDAVAVCFSAPETQVGTIAQIDEALAHLGPDLLAPGFDADDASARSHSSAAGTVSDLLLDQRVMAGVGNVYKSEILFLERLHPESPASALSADQRLALAVRARELLWANRDQPDRSTTGSRRPGQQLFVYGRDRRSCRRCDTGIVAGEVGNPPRITYWCPRCQRSPDEKGE